MFASRKNSAHITARERATAQSFSRIGVNLNYKPIFCCSHHLGRTNLRCVYKSLLVKEAFGSNQTHNLGSSRFCSTFGLACSGTAPDRKARIFSLIFFLFTHPPSKLIDSHPRAPCAALHSLTRVQRLISFKPGVVLGSKDQ